MEIYKRKRNKTIFIILIFSCITVTISGIIKNYVSLSTIEWFKNLRDGLIFTVVIFIIILVFEYIYLKKLEKSGKL
jgi:quinol-cytochrome oxidoreductase complex cytochrome b subunit